jgi:hypothetical protein
VVVLAAVAAHASDAWEAARMAKPVGTDSRNRKAVVFRPLQVIMSG